MGRGSAPLPPGRSVATLWSMSLTSLNLPIDIPWRQIAVSPDMMDTAFCDKRYPFAWRSSLALSVFEPSEDDLPEQTCGRRLTYLKVTATITGYEPTAEETAAGYTAFPDVPTEQLDRVLRDYFACYGVLLNVAVFPGPASGSVSTLTRVNVDVAGRAPGSTAPNPLTLGSVTVNRPGATQNEIVDLHPAGGDARGELAIGGDLALTVPASARVTARVVTAARPVTMEAYAGTSLVSVVQSGPETDREHELTAEGDGITALRLICQGDASLVSLSYWTRSARKATLADFPHIIDFEPKNRDLYESVSDTSEVLTGSVSKVVVDKSMAHTDTTEMGLGKTVKYTSPQSSYGQLETTNSITGKWGATSTDTDKVNIDGSRDRRERYASTTTITQMYNLLTGYHAGTNRAVFLMLPRPHVLQPTSRRTFVRGLRVIEGIQEFFLVIERGADTEGLCIEARLETGHFPERVDVQQPAVIYDERTETFRVTAYARGGGGFDAAGTTDIATQPSATYQAPTGWLIDRTKGDPGHGGLSEVADASNQRGRDSLQAYNYRAKTDTDALVEGQISGKFNESGAIFDRTYEVYLRSEKPRDEGEATVSTPFLITSRQLCVCYRSTDGCPEVVGPKDGGGPNPMQVSIVDEPPITTVHPGSSAVAADTLRQVRTAMLTSWRMPSRRPPGTVGFLESNYFTRQIAPHLPEHQRRQPLSHLREAAGLPAPLAEATTVEDLLSGDLGSLSKRSGVDVGELARLRRRVLRLPDEGPSAPNAELR
jgi:hypothetical protein